MISDDATEFKIKNLNALSESEIISFSTHALINNELNNDNEPSLILTPDYQNDGFNFIRDNVSQNKCKISNLVSMYSIRV